MLVNYENEFSYKSFNLLLWFLEIILILFFTTNDIILFFIFFELSLVPIFLIIIIWGSTVRRTLASYYFFIYTTLGAVLMLFGIFLIISECNTTNFLLLELYKFEPTKQIILFFFFFWAFAIKIPMFPFYLWLPEAHV
jgi:NADH:ubiquinone oxidoreductase subunit 4 (subunit M)